jgi:dTDP-glucose 4,6-dehydratase
LTASPTPPTPSLLLGRPEVAGDLAAATDWLRGRRVLVTGAAGSVGWNLSRLLAGAETASLVLLDHHEHSLFSLERALVATGHHDNVAYELLDVRDPRRLSRALQRHRPQVIVHLAAAKHVPYGERFPEGVVEANVLATQSLLDLAAETGVETFVYPSSDKSVAPPSLYGATKRLCEALVQQRALNAPSEQRWPLVRYVNIIGTRGSVIETFTQQVQQGSALSVTDERMTRYWISMDEALWVILANGRCGPQGSIAMVDCGEPVPVLETARRLAGWYQPEIQPYPIMLTGIRPGERLHEVLVSDKESWEPGPAAGLQTVHTRRDPACLAEAPAIAAELRRLIEAGADGAQIRETAMEAANRLQ